MSQALAAEACHAGRHPHPSPRCALCSSGRDQVADEHQASQLEAPTWHDEIDDADYGDADVYYGCGRLLPTPTAQY